MNKLKNPQLIQTAKQLVRLHFKDDYGNPYEMTDSQAEIFLIIFLRLHPRNQVISYTQFGKSDIVSMALILRSYVFNEPWGIVSGQREKSMIIMSRVIQHIFDNQKFINALEFDPNMPLDRLRRERSKEKIQWRGGGGIQIFTANSRNRAAVKEALTGFGSPNLIEDEASLIPDNVQAMIMRMLGGHKDNFLLKIGNPFYRNHFQKSWQSEKYYKVFVDYEVGIAEGRVTQEFIDEMRSQPFFSILYECKFPDNSAVEIEGWFKLIPDELLEQAFITEEEFKNLCTEQITKDDAVVGMKPVGMARLGCDFAGGGRDKSAYVVRWDKVMKLISTNHIADTMQQAGIAIQIIDDNHIDDSGVAFDYGGLGQGIGDRVRELEREVNLIMFGESSPEDQYANMRAYMYYQFFKWLKDGGKIVKDDGFYEFLSVNYKANSSGKLLIQPKEELKKVLKLLGLDATSPDVGDAAVLTFAPINIISDDDWEII